MEITLNNNEKIKENGKYLILRPLIHPYFTNIYLTDHVYCASNWAIRDGTPYSIARIMQFLPPVGLSPPVRAKKGSEYYTRARIAWYYRPGDISDRQVSDSRLLLAAIYTEIIPISHLRGKCWVRHKDKIPDLLAWRKKPDRFYYVRLFDPFIKKEFEVLLTVEIQNREYYLSLLRDIATNKYSSVPKHIRQVLTARYEYVIAEKEIVSDLVDDLRLCHTCGDWCSTYVYPPLPTHVNK